MRVRSIVLALAFGAGCSKSDKKPDPPAASATAALVPSASAASSGHGHHEDRHDPADKPALELEVKIGGATKTWAKDAFDRVPKLTKGNVGNDGEDRDTWSLRDLAHALVGPNARVVSVTGPEETKTIDAAAWSDASRTPIVHTTRRGTLKFRWADKDGKWGGADVKDVSRLEIQP
ncbi:MAG TPA: hypothetical protein VIF62_00330 [Labilithrix sp.]